MKVFITGGSGLLGQYLNRELSLRHDILTQYYSNEDNCKDYNSIRLSITDFEKLSEVFTSFKPDVVIHTAAISNAEKVDVLAPKIVYEVNINATLKIAELCEKHKAKMVYLSTDLVYAGYRGSLLKEDSKLIPISFYAESKLMGEVKITGTFDNYLILREALILGFGLNHSRNNFHLMYENLAAGKPVKLFTDQFRSPISVYDAAHLIGRLVEKDIKGETINFGGTERASRYQIGEAVCEMKNFDKRLLQATTMEEADLKYKIADVSMNIDKLRSFGIEPKPFIDSLREILNGK